MSRAVFLWPNTCKIQEIPIFPQKEREKGQKREKKI
jgi:hypothetical protein